MPLQTISGDLYVFLSLSVQQTSVLIKLKSRLRLVLPVLRLWGEMGKNGAGNIDLSNGDSGMGFNPAAMMTSIAVGSAARPKIVRTMGNAMVSMNVTAPGAVPPSVLVVAYYVDINGEAAGPSIWQC